MCNKTVAEQLAEAIRRQELLAEAIEKIAIAMNIIDGTVPMTGPQVLMIADECAELAKELDV